jgi:hypothetical protein
MKNRARATLNGALIMHRRKPGRLVHWFVEETYLAFTRKICIVPETK